MSKIESNFFIDYSKPLILDGNYLLGFKRTYNKFKEDFLLKTIDNSQKIIQKYYKFQENRILENNNRNEGITGLMIGKIQSGKTSNFLALMCLAFDNNFDITIVIGGKDKDLQKQNEKRINEVFGEFRGESLEFLSSTNNFDGMSVDSIEDIIPSDKKLILSCLKHDKKNLKLLLNMFKGSDYLKNKKVLIIDDEGDQASLNANYTKTTDDVDHKPTAIYKTITDLRKLLSQELYISVTATPQANILISKKDILYPDFLKLIEPSFGYLGAKDFFGKKSGNVVTLVPEIITKNKNKNKNKIDNNAFFYMKNEDPINNNNFYEALSTFWISSAWAENDSPHEKSKICYSMLIHCDRKKTEHESIRTNVDSKWKDIKNTLNIYENDKTNIQADEFIDFINKGFLKVLNRKINLSNVVDKEILKIIIRRIKKTRISVINGDEKNKYNRDEKSIKMNNEIRIGSVLLERGITIKHLLTVYITIRAQGKTGIDTILQRARWFGYRAEYFAYLKIFCTERILKDYQNIIKSDDHLWGEVKKVDEGILSMKDWVPKIITHSKDLRPTRKSVTNATEKNKNQWAFQKSYKKNDIFEIEEIKLFLEQSQEEGFDENTHRTMTFDSLEDFKNYFHKSWNIIFNKCNIHDDFFTENYKIKVIYLRPFLGKEAYRTVKDINNISLSRVGKPKEGSYKGDLNLMKYKGNENKIILEINYLKLFEYNSEKKKYKGKLLFESSYFYSIYSPDTKRFYSANEKNNSF